MYGSYKFNDNIAGRSAGRLPDDAHDAYPDSLNDDVDFDNDGIASDWLDEDLYMDDFDSMLED